MSVMAISYAFTLFQCRVLAKVWDGKYFELWLLSFSLTLSISWLPQQKKSWWLLLLRRRTWNIKKNNRAMIVYCAIEIELPTSFYVNLIFFLINKNRYRYGYKRCPVLVLFSSWSKQHTDTRNVKIIIENVISLDGSSNLLPSFCCCVKNSWGLW